MIQTAKLAAKSLVSELLFWFEVIFGCLIPHPYYKESFLLWLANSLPRSQKSDQRLRAQLLRKAGMEIGFSGTICAPIEIRPLGAASNVKIGQGCFINTGVRFGCTSLATITIGNHVLIGPRCSFETMNHSVELADRHKKDGFPASIVVEDNVWIAAGVTVLPRVRIGQGSVVAAGAVVTTDIPPHTLVGGVPTRVIRQIATAPQEAVLTRSQPQN